MKENRKFKQVVWAALLAVVFGSCSKDEDNLIVEGPQGGSITLVDLDWNGKDNGQYSEAEAKADFGNMSGWQSSRVSFQNQHIAVTMLANKLSGAGGIVANMDLPPSPEVRISYDVLFPDDFIWGRGGKVGFGLRIGDGNTGCDKADDGNGGSARIMWYTSDNGVTKFKPYLYYVDMPGECGDNLDGESAYPAEGSIQKEKWYTIEMRVKSNLSELADGHIEILIDGQSVLDSPIRWTTNNTKRLINRLAFSTFRGGSQEHWKVDQDTQIYFDNLKVERIY